MINTVTLENNPTNSPRTERFLSLVALLLGIALPTSNLLMNIMLVIIVIGIVIDRSKKPFLQLLHNPLVVLPILMFTLLALSLIYHNNDYGPQMVEKYKKLLFVFPLAAFFFQRRQLTLRFCQGFLLANALIVVLSVFIGILNIHVGHINPSNPTIFKRHITHNFFMSLAALGWLALAFRSVGWKRGIYCALVLLALIDVVFLVTGRTGYVGLVAGTGLWLFLSLTNRHRLTVSVLAIAAVGILLIVPNRATHGLTKGADEIQRCIMASPEDAYDACSTSMGQRTAFARHAFSLIGSAPILGHGAGGFLYQNLATDYRIYNPHNEYLIETIQSGLIGLMIFLGWVFCCYRAAWQLPREVKNICVSVLTSYMACNLFNSFLLDSAEGHLFMILAAMLCAYTVEKSYAVEKS